jgi:hypothetical protein
MKSGMKLWHVEASAEQTDRDYRKNLNIWVFATTFDIAYQKVRESYPQATIWKIMGDRWASDVIVAD